MNSDAVLSLYRQSGALLEGHFRLTSGLHSPGYLQSALVLQHPVHAEALGRALADRLRAAAPTAVLSPALGGLIIGHEVARALGVRAIFAERVDGTLALRRGFSLSSADRVVVIEDIVTTGGSTRETIVVATDAGATVIGAGSIIDRSGGSSDVGVPFQALAALTGPHLRSGVVSALPGRDAGREAGLERPDIRDANAQAHDRLRRDELRRLAAADQRAVGSAGRSKTPSRRSSTMPSGGQAWQGPAGRTRACMPPRRWRA